MLLAYTIRSALSFAITRMVYKSEGGASEQECNDEYLEDGLTKGLSLNNSNHYSWRENTVCQEFRVSADKQLI